MNAKSRRRSRLPPRQPGFTLIELLAAMALLALLLLGVWSGIATATRTVHRGQAAVERLDAIRAAHGFVRRELAQAMAIPFARQDDGDGVIFDGSATSMRFVAPLPGYLGKLGPQLQTLRLVRDDDGYRLEAAFALLPPDGGPPQAFGEPQVLLRGIRSGRFVYRGLDERGKPSGWQGGWQGGWPQAVRTPALVRVDLELDGGRWPLLETPIRVDPTAVNGAGGLLRQIVRPRVGGR